MTIQQLRDRLLPGVATILLAACSNNQQPSSDAHQVGDAAPAAPLSATPSNAPETPPVSDTAPPPSSAPSASTTASGAPAAPAPLPAPAPPVAKVAEKIAEAAPPPASWARCAVCHSAEKGAPAKLGPNLYGVYGHTMGQGSYAFSDALKASGLTLDDATLDKWLENPRALVPGNRMSFPGLKDPAKRAEIIAYLKQQR